MQLEKAMHHPKREQKSMLKSEYENKIQLRLLCVLGTLFLFAVSFYSLQNAGVFAGGNIALPKLIWLTYAILYWYALPLLFITDKRTPSTFRQAYSLFSANMFTRAGVELYMMYGTHNWHPYYGLGHDIFTICLLTSLYLWVRHSNADFKTMIFYLVVMIAMFIVEIGFVLYLLELYTEKGQQLYFISENDQHSTILLLTWAAIIVLTYYLTIFTKRWLHESTKSTGSTNAHGR
jgi:hypothetical protein